MTRPPRMIFIVGAPRSGTTWLLSMLEHHPQCRWVSAESLGIRTERPTKETGIFLRGFSKAEIVRRYSRLPRDRVLVEKTPGHLLQVGRIKRVFPEARIVLMRRSAEDVIWSMVQKNAFWDASPKTVADAVELYNSFAAAQAGYGGFDATVDYEQLWRDPVAELSRVLNLLGLDPGPAGSLVERVRHGKALPAELTEVFREGSPGQAATQLTDSEKNFITQHVLTPDRRERPLSVLLATNHLLGWTGSETLTSTLIDGLLRRGCRVAVYTRFQEPEWVDRNFDPRVELLDDLGAVKRRTFDVAHVQHNTCAIDVRAAFPSLPIVFCSLGVLPFLEQPVAFDIGVSRYVALSREIADNLAAHGVPAHKIQIVRNMVSGKLFFPMSAIRERPERILVLSYKMDEARKELLRGAAGRIGASIRFTDGAGGVIPQDGLRQAMDDSDVVVTLGRGVIEAMFCGRVPLVFDVHGGDGLVTPESLHDLESCNFSGRRFRRQYSIEDLVAELGRYRQDYGSRLRELACETYGHEINTARLVALYHDVIAESTHATREPAENLQVQFISAMMREDRLLAEAANRRLGSERLEVARIKGTISWRLTAPLRVFFNTYRRLLAALSFRKATSQEDVG